MCAVKYREWRIPPEVMERASLVNRSKVEAAQGEIRSRMVSS